MILGLDQAPRGIGYAYGEPGGIPKCGWHELPDFGDNTARLGAAAREWTATQAREIGARRIDFEQIIVRKFGLHMPTLYRQFAVVGGIEQAAEMLGLQDHCYQVMIADWRTEFYAGMRPPKNSDEESALWKDMALKECARRGWWTDNHNAAEACGIWDWACKAADPAYRHRSRVDKRRQQGRHDENRRNAL